MDLPKLPPLPRMRGPRKPGKARAGAGPEDLDRSVQWREGQEEEGELEHTYGTCAKCGRRRQALDLTWRPDRVVDGELFQGFWACRFGCEEED